MEPNSQNIMSIEPPSKKSKNPLIIIGLIYVLVVVALISAIIVVRVTRGGNRSKPTPELAKSVCEKYGGVFEETENLGFDKNYNCVGKKGTAAFLTNGTQFTIGFVEDDKKDELWSKTKALISDSEGHEDVSKYVVLENTNDFIKAYVTMAGLVRIYLVLYDNAMASVAVQSDSAAEEMIAALGFPNGKRAENYKDSNNNTTNDASNTNDTSDVSDDEDEAGLLVPTESRERDAQRRDDYAILATAMNSYLANNRGTFDDMVNEDNDPRTLTASRWINSDGKDPNGNLYDLKAYTYETWSNTDKIPVDDNGSQVFVIIHANCHGTDSNGDPMPAEDASKRAFAVYGYLESDGYFCQASGSAS